jgi:hypothetical protein
MNLVSLQTMKKIITNKTRRLISAFIIGAFVFSFLHSELGLFDYDNGHHEHHDYCKIVDGKTTRINKVTVSQQIKPPLEKIAIIPNEDDFTNHKSSTLISVKYELLIPPDNIDLYIHNSTFLI